MNEHPMLMPIHLLARPQDINMISIKLPLVQHKKFPYNQVI